MAEKQCSNCGAAASKTALYCKRCAAPLTESAAEKADDLTRLTEDVLDGLESGSAGTGESGSAPDPDRTEEHAPAESSDDPPPENRAGCSQRFRIEVMNGLNQGEKRTLSPEQTLLVGANCDAGLPLTHDPLVSRRHACLWLEDGRVFVKDEGSTNGTLLRIGTSARELAEGDVLLIGETLLRLTEEE